MTGQNQILNEFIDYFQESALNNKRIFIPMEKQEGVVKNLIVFHDRYYTVDILFDMVDLYMKSCNSEAVRIFDFALEAAQYRDKVLEIKKDQEHINELMQRTKKRMENINEL